eukprot:10361169-Karenia_brevis.AAC.1
MQFDVVFNDTTAPLLPSVLSPNLLLRIDPAAVCRASHQQQQLRAMVKNQMSPRSRRRRLIGVEPKHSQVKPKRSRWPRQKRPKKF